MVAQVQQVSVWVDSIARAIVTTYVRQGTEQPSLLLLHGFDSSLLEFRRLLPLLSAQFRTWAVDLLGFGFTERPNAIAISPKVIREHLYGFWQQMIQEPVVLVGASMGGAAALDLTLRYPEMVKQLVLIDSAGYRRGPFLGRFLPHQFGKLVTEGFLRRPQVRQSISERAYFDPGWASVDAQCCAALHLDCPNWANALIAFTRSGGYGSFRQQLAQIQVPTLILWGRNDQILGTKDAQPMQQAIVNSRLCWIDECGHVPHLEKADPVSRQIQQFIRSAEFTADCGQAP